MLRFIYSPFKRGPCIPCLNCSTRLLSARRRLAAGGRCRFLAAEDADVDFSEKRAHGHCEGDPHPKRVAATTLCPLRVAQTLAR